MTNSQETFGQDTGQSTVEAAGTAEATPLGAPASTGSAAPAAPASGVWRSLRRFFWMDERLASAVRDGFGPGLAGWDDFKAGREALRAAEQLGESDERDNGTLLLRRAATVLLARAHLARAGLEPEPAAAPNEDWTRLAEQSGASRSAEDVARDHQSPTVARDLRGRVGAGWNDFELGRDAVRAAERLRESGGAEGSFLLLHRTAALLFIRARLAGPGGALGPVAVSDQDWSRLAQLEGVSPLVGTLSVQQRELVAASVGPEGESYLAKLSNDERRAAARLLGRVAQRLAAPLVYEARRVAGVLVMRWLRIGLSAAVLLTPAAYGIARTVSFEERNLALHRPVVMSSVYAGDVGHDPSLLVDGDTSNLGFHTDRGGHQYVTIDLGTVQSVHKVVVYNRADCCADKAVPLRIEVSKDGKAFRRVAMRKTTFDVWKATFSAVDARYVRLTSLRGDYFHLAEVQVF